MAYIIVCYVRKAKNAKQAKKAKKSKGHIARDQPAANISMLTRIRYAWKFSRLLLARGKGQSQDSIFGSRQSEKFVRTDVGRLH